MKISGVLKFDRRWRRGKPRAYAFSDAVSFIFLLYMLVILYIHIVDVIF